MEITDEQIDAIFGDSPFIARRKADKSGYEIVQQTNDDWQQVITDKDFKHCGDFDSMHEANIICRRLHVRWILQMTSNTI